ncbi:MAG: hypothetical protein J6S14_04450 [Clostridia bacterium]|nr:hypothetical protein [Clostridia bacterium]
MSKAEHREPRFAAANSGNGFHSFYPSVFEGEEIQKRYIIKGGPGTGKSSFMRSVAEVAAARGMTVDEYRCSSDPASIDGLVLDGRIVLLDGTAPHVVDATLPGVRDEIVNLGEFWDAERLSAYHNDIVAYSALKAHAYRRGYRYLSAAMEVEAAGAELVFPSVREEKLCSVARRMLSELPDGEGAELRAGLADSIGMRGRVRFSYYEQTAKKLFIVDDYFGTGALFLSELIAQGQRKGLSMHVSYQPVSPERPDAVLFVTSGVCFVLGEYTEREPDGRVNMKRFVDTERLTPVKVEYRAGRRLWEALIEEACEALREAGRYHMELEKIYSSCMDFEAEKAFVKLFCEKIK